MSVPQTDHDDHRNCVLEELQRGRAAESRPAQLESAVKALLLALDQQHLDRRPPGSYHYSANVGAAMGFARGLVKVTDPGEPPLADQATTWSWPMSGKPGGGGVST